MAISHRKNPEPLPRHAFGQRSGYYVSKVSIGGMRFPKDADDAVALLRHAIDSGMRYVDSSRGYEGSEWMLRLALKDGYRQKVILSTKWAPWCVMVRPTDSSAADCVRRRIDESLRRLDVSYLDFYQIWGFSTKEQYAQVVAKGGMLEGIQKAKKERLVRHIGFTTHAPVPELLQYIEEADWCEVILMSYNMLYRQYAPAIEAAHKKGIGTLIMNPVGGGKLAQKSPVLLQLAKDVGAASISDMALRYLFSNPNIDTILCGMEKTADVDDTVASARRDVFTPEQMAHIDSFMDRISVEKKAFCTWCKYCMPCPQGIHIPQIMSMIFDDRVLGFKEESKKRYQAMKEPRADACVKCGKCEKACTQHLKISKEMAYAAKTYAAAKK